MDLRPATAPPLFPAWVSIEARVLAHGHHSQHFAAGRACAARALARMDGRLEQAEIIRGPGGEPLWPSGFTGSITHTADYVAAAVARMSDALSLGLDTQQVVDADRAVRLWRRVVMPEEHDLGAGDLPVNIRFCLLFAIKEATFKCLYPVVQRRFYFEAFAVHTLDPAAGTFSGHLRQELKRDFPVGYRVEGRIGIEDDRVHAGLVLPAN